MHLSIKAALALLISAVLAISLYASQDHTQDSNDHAHSKDHSNEEQHAHEAERLDPHDHHEEEHEENETELSQAQLDTAKVKIDTAGPVNLTENFTLFGQIQTPQDQIFRLHATYESLVKKVHVNIGDKVKKSQKLITLYNKQTLQNYTLTSPAKGEITARLVNVGDHADENTLLELRDLSKVWVQLTGFPEQMDRLLLNQTVEVFDLHHHKTQSAPITYISPLMSQGHMNKVRATIKNDNKHWRPGMHVKAKVSLMSGAVPVAVNNEAIQILDGKKVVFVKRGDHLKAQAVRLGKTDEHFSEVLSGLKAGDQYVSENSFVIKAHLLKSGATHSH